MANNIAEVKSRPYDRLTDATELQRSIQAEIDTVQDVLLCGGRKSTSQEALL